MQSSPLQRCCESDSPHVSGKAGRQQAEERSKGGDPEDERLEDLMFDSEEEKDRSVKFDSPTLFKEKRKRFLSMGPSEKVDHSSMPYNPSI